MLLLKKTLQGLELTIFKEHLEQDQQKSSYLNENRQRDFIQESSARSKRNIIDYGLSNKWTHFITLTFDPKKHNRYQYTVLIKKITKWLENYKYRYDPSLKYILSPELHKDKALHIHGLVKLNNIQHLKYVKTRDKATIYEHIMITEAYGFNEFTKIYDHIEFITYYISKYVAKNFNEKILPRRYYASKDLHTPDKLYIQEKDIKHELRDILSVVPTYQGQFATKWKLTKADLYAIFRYNQQVKDFIKTDLTVKIKRSKL